MDELDTFITEIVDTKNLPGLTDEVKKSLVEDMKNQLLDQVDRALLEELSDDQLDEFSEQVEQSGDDDAAQTYLLSHGVDVEKVTARTMLAFRDLYLQSSPERQEG